MQSLIRASSGSNDARTLPVPGVKAITAEADINSGPRNSLGNELTLQIKKLKQKDVLTQKLISGRVGRELHRGSAGKQNDLHKHGDLGAGHSKRGSGTQQVHNYLRLNLLQPPCWGCVVRGWAVNNFSCIVTHSFFTFPAWPCRFTPCTLTGPGLIA